MTEAKLAVRFQTSFYEKWGVGEGIWSASVGAMNSIYLCGTAFESVCDSELVSTCNELCPTRTGVDVLIRGRTRSGQLIACHWQPCSKTLKKLAIL